MEITEVKRIFEYNNLSLEDPDSTMTPEAVKQFYTTVYPELSQAIIGEVERRGDTLVYPITRAVGTKGGEKSPPITVESLAKMEQQKKEKMEDPLWPHRTLSQLLTKKTPVGLERNNLKTHHLSLLP